MMDLAEGAPLEVICRYPAASQKKTKGKEIQCDIPFCLPSKLLILSLPLVLSDRRHLPSLPPRSLVWLRCRCRNLEEARLMIFVSSLAENTPLCCSKARN